MSQLSPPDGLSEAGEAEKAPAARTDVKNSAIKAKQAILLLLILVSLYGSLDVGLDMHGESIAS
jgi:hypothetical protein